MKFKKCISAIFICMIFFSYGFSQEVAEEKDKKETVLDVIQSERSEEEICDYLKNNKISKKELNAKDENGYTPLYLAIDSGKSAVLETLLEKGAKKDLTTNLNIHDKSGRKILRCSPVLFAAWKGEVKCLEILMNKGSVLDIESDFIIPTASNTTYIRLLNPIDAAFYNRRNIDFNAVHKQLASAELNYEHIHYSGAKWAYTKIKTHDLLKEYNLLEIKE